MAQRYRLEALLKLRLKEKKNQEQILARALFALKEAREKLKKLEEKKTEMIAQQKESRKKMGQKMITGPKIGEGNWHVNFLRKIKEDLMAKEEEIEDQKIVIEEAIQKVAKVRKDYIEAIKKLRIMQKHKELWAKKIRREITRQEEKVMDELGQTIHGLRRWRGEKSVFQI